MTVPFNNANMASSDLEMDSKTFTSELEVLIEESAKAGKRNLIFIAKKTKYSVYEYIKSKLVKSGYLVESNRAEKTLSITW